MARSVQTQVDSADFFVQAFDATSPIIATQTATNGTGSSPQSADITNTLHKGCVLFATIASVSVNTATLAVNFLGKNVVDGAYYFIQRVSVDGIVTPLSFSFILNPAWSGTGATFSGAGGASAIAGGILPRVFAVQASLTVTTTASMSGTVAYAIRGMSKVL